jgi:hypothetical protein
MSSYNIQNIIFEDINAEYGRGKYGDFEVIIMKSNAYINATKLCSNGGKQYKNWFNLQGSQKLIKYFQENLVDIKSPVSIVKKVGKGLCKVNGTYVHPALIPHIATWISPAFSFNKIRGTYVYISSLISPVFAFNVSKIINNWRSLSPLNEMKYWTDMGLAFDETKDLSSHCRLEEEYRNKIAEEENGQIEVQTKSGFIDVLTDTKIIEVKTAINWKHAIGQVQCYALEYDDKEMWIYLFNHEDCDKELISSCCNKFNIQVNYI